MESTWSQFKTIRINVCLYGLATPQLLFRILICHRLFQNKINLRVLNFRWPFNRGQDNRKTLIGTTTGGRSRLEEVAG